MKALILAAGRGERMRPLSDHTPKPLLPVHGKPLIEWHLEALARAGVREVVVNTAWLEEQFPAALGNGSRYGVHIDYSFEGRDHGQALETAGGIAKALPLLGETFWVVSGDIWAPEFKFASADAHAFERSGALGDLWFVPNRSWHPAGDFGIDADGLASRASTPRLTYANVALFRAELFRDVAPGTRLALRPKFEEAIDRRALRAQRWDGRWDNLGTPEQLAALNAAPG
ncbi:MAG: N-acetylmuramate alpha-1-phosphate uridylyltransferase MurU [Burkholderiaceae bacterium]|jgi:MurNAc alpha-1-phosphate uridylyltransferase